MKKITLLLITLLTAASLFAADIAAGQKFTLIAGVWTADNARFAAYFYDNSDPQNNAWVDMTPVEGAEGVYEVTAPAMQSGGAWAKLILCRMKPDNLENNWDNKWNQTPDLEFDGIKTTYAITDWNTGEWREYAVFSNMRDNAYLNDDITFTASAVGTTSEFTYTATLITPGATTEIPLTGNTFKADQVGDYTLKITPKIGTETLSVIEEKLHVVIPFEGGQRLYLDASQWTAAANGKTVRYAAYFFDKDGATQWCNLEAAATEHLYTFLTPTGRWQAMIFVMMNADNSENSWENKIAQTINIECADAANNKFTVKNEKDGDNYKVEQTTDGTLTATPDVKATPEIYTVGATIISNMPMEIFTITGINVTETNGRLHPGAYIVRTAAGIRKVMVK